MIIIVAIPVGAWSLSCLELCASVPSGTAGRKCQHHAEGLCDGDGDDDDEYEELTRGRTLEHYEQVRGN